MKTKKLITLIVPLFALLLFGCKRESLSTEPVVQQSGISEKVKAWYEARPASLQSNSTKTISQSDGKISKPQWDKTKYYPADQLYITPVAIDNPTAAGNNTLHKYLVVEGTADGPISSGRYIYIVTKKDAGSTSPLVANPTPAFINSKQVPPGFNGAVFEYDLENKPASGTNFEDGRISNKTTKLSYKAASTNSTPGYADPNCEGEVVCIDWYWQTWVNGELVYEEYLYTTCECQEQGGGGGGGGGTPTPEQQANAVLNYMENQTTIRSTLLSTTEEVLDPDHKYLIYEWTCLTGPGYIVKSWEKGGLEKVYSLPTPYWKFTSFIHLNIATEGVAIGGTVNITELWNNPTMGILISHMSLGLQIHYTTTFVNIPYHRYFQRTPTLMVRANNSTYVNPDL